MTSSRTTGRQDATALPLGTTVSSFIFTRNDEDWYRIVTTAEGHLVVTLNVPESVGYELTLLNSSLPMSALTLKRGRRGRRGYRDRARRDILRSRQGVSGRVLHEDELPGEYSQARDTL